MAKIMKKDEGDKKVKDAKQLKKPKKSPLAYVKEVIAELKKVTWPTKKEIASYSVVVFSFIVVMSCVLLLMDTGFGKLLELILSI